MTTATPACRLRVDWDAERGGYCVGEFYMDGRECEAWYSPDGSWMMTEVDYGRNLQALPQAVQDGYNATTYAQDGWRIDDIDEIQRPGYENVYKIEVEKAGQPDHDLYFDLGGTLFRDVQDDGRDHDNSGMIHDRLPAALSDYINTQYPGAAIVDFDRGDRGYYEVDLRHEGKSIEVVFDREGNWVMSKTDCDRNVPAVVSEAVARELPGARIDDCDYIETPAGSYWLVETERPERDLRVTADGQVDFLP